MPSTAGVCMYENFRLEYHVVNLEYIHNKLLKIEAVCLNPYNECDREATFKYSTNNFNIQDERLKISFTLLDSVAKNLNLDMDKLYKLIVKDNKVFYIYVL